MSSMWAMPETTVQKMIGAITMRISATKPSPSGFIFCARPGSRWPRTAPTTIANSTWTYRILQNGVFMSRAFVAAPVRRRSDDSWPRAIPIRPGGANASGGRRILLEVAGQQGVQRGRLALERHGRHEEGLDRDGEELLDGLRAVRVDD